MLIARHCNGLHVTDCSKLSVYHYYYYYYYYTSVAIVCRRLLTIDVINVCNVYQKKLINAFVIFVNVYNFNERQVKCRKANSGAFSGVYFVVIVWE